MKNYEIEHSFSELWGKDLRIVINGCKTCIFRRYNKEMKTCCHWTEEELTEDEKWGSSVEHNCPLPKRLIVATEQKEIIIMLHAYTQRRLKQKPMLCGYPVEIYPSGIKVGCKEVSLLEIEKILQEVHKKKGIHNDFC